MKAENPDKFLKVSKLIKKLGELAEVLDDVSTKMRLAVEKQKISLEHLGQPNREGRRVLNKLQKKLECLDSVPLTSVQIATAQDLSHDLIESDSDDRNELRAMTYHEYVEFTCLDEYKKFRNLPSISPEEIQLCDWEDLCDRFVTDC